MLQLCRSVSFIVPILLLIDRLQFIETQQYREYIYIYTFRRMWKNLFLIYLNFNFIFCWTRIVQHRQSKSNVNGNQLFNQLFRKYLFI